MAGMTGMTDAMRRRDRAGAAQPRAEGPRTAPSAHPAGNHPAAGQPAGEGAAVDAADPAGGGRPSRRRPLLPGRAGRLRAGSLLRGLLGIAVVLGGWQLAVSAGLISARELPPPHEVIGRAAELVVDARFLEAVGHTLWAWLLSMVLTCVAVIPLGILLGYFTVLYRSAVAAVHAARSVPATVFIPVAILLFGLGTEMKVAIVCFAIVWPLLLNTMYGVHNTERQLLLVADSLRWGRAARLVRVVLPSAVPYITSGVRIASSLAMVVIVAVELLSANSGVGTEIVRYENADRADSVYAAVLVVGLLGAFLYSALAVIERLAFPWLLRGEGDR